MWGGSSDPQNSEAWEECLVNFLQECTNITTLCLYFKASHFERQWIKLRDAVLSLITQGKLTSLVFCNSDPYFRSKSSYCEYNVHPILQGIAESETAQFRLKSLNLSLFTALSETEKLIKSSFPNLEHLRIHRTFQWRPKFRHVDGWKRLDFLRRLQIHKCKGIAASDIPNIVAFFPALKELIAWDLKSPISDTFRERYPEGWHLLPRALCNTHRPLDWIHIHDMNPGQIPFLGTIPTRMLIITDTRPEIVLAGLQEDMHLFPRMKTLRRPNTESWVKFGPSRIANDIALNEWCAVRNIEVEVASYPHMPLYR
jgi:hypothetical protein